MQYFCNIIDYLSKIKLSRHDFVILSRIITRYAYTNNRRFKLDSIDSPKYKCREQNQDINPTFWAYSLLLKLQVIMMNVFC